MRTFTFAICLLSTIFSFGGDDFIFTCTAPDEEVSGVGIYVVAPDGSSTVPSAAVCNHIPGECAISQTVKVWPGTWHKVCSYQYPERIVTVTTSYFFAGFFDGFESEDTSGWDTAIE